MSERILIARSGRLGDMVMVAPAVREIIERHPDAEFTFFTSSDGAALFRDFDSRIVRFFVNGKTPFTRRLKWIYLFFKIRKMNFDLTYCLDGDWRIRQLLKKSTGNLFVFDEHNISGVMHAAVWALHAVGVNAKSLSDIEIPFIRTDARKKLDMQNFLHQHGITDEDILVGLNPSFSGLNRKKTRKYKLWAPENWAALADELYQYGKERNIPIKIVIYSLPKEKFLAESICSLSKHSPILLIPQPDLEFFKAYLSRLNLYIGPDSGGTHLAAGVGTDLIALYAVTDPYDCGPVVKDIGSSVIRAEEKGGTDVSLDLITVNDVFNLAKSKIEKLVSN